jgi:hypothetical protein
MEADTRATATDRSMTATEAIGATADATIIALCHGSGVNCTAKKGHQAEAPSVRGFFFWSRRMAKCSAVRNVGKAGIDQPSPADLSIYGYTSEVAGRKR